jgi:glucose dehydrogenase
MLFIALVFAATGASIATSQTAPPAMSVQWPSYGGDVGGQRYSPLDQINQQNVNAYPIPRDATDPAWRTWRRQTVPWATR